MEHLGISLDSRELESSSEFVIFTHSVKTRYLVLTSFCLYLVIFFFFMAHLKEQVNDLAELPLALKAMEENQSFLLTYGLIGIGAFIAVVIMCYLFWAVVDVWGIQVQLSTSRIQVRNTITGMRFKKIMGVGDIPFSELEEVEGGFFSTRLIGTQGVVRFSPVERIEVLIARIMDAAPKATINVR